MWGVRHAHLRTPDTIQSGAAENNLSESKGIEHTKSNGGVTNSQSSSDISEYKLRFSNEIEIPNDGTIHSSQRENMGRAVDYLVEEYQVTSRINLPYNGDIGRPVINSEPRKSDDSEMAAPYELSDGNYLRTTMSGTEKMRALKGIAQEVNLEVWFSGKWQE